jgi:hypothetical protein
VGFGVVVLVLELQLKPALLIFSRKTMNVENYFQGIFLLMLFKNNITVELAEQAQAVIALFYGRSRNCAHRVVSCAGLFPTTASRG